MKIALLGPTHPIRGGISQFTTLLADALAERHDVTLYSFARLYDNIFYRKPEVFDQSENALHCQKALVNNGLTFNPVSWIATARHIKNELPDALLVTWWQPNLLPLYYIIIKLSGIKKIVFICHDVVPHESRFFDTHITRFALGLGTGIIVHAESEKKIVRHLLPEKNCTLSFHPLYEIFSEKKMGKKSARKKLGVKGNVLLSFGIIRKYKGLNYLLDALPTVLKQRPITLLVAGEFVDEKEKYVHLIREKGIEDHVKITPQYIPNEDVASFFCAADLVIHPCTYATQTGVIPTAYAFNKPVVVTRVGGLPDAVEDGKTGYVVAAENASELASAILRYFSERRQVNFERNIKEKKKSLSWPKYVLLVERAIQESN